MAKIEQKQVIVNEIKEKLEKATSVVMVDARGLTVEQDTALRKQLREAGVDYKVYKHNGSLRNPGYTVRRSGRISVRPQHIRILL